MGGMFPHLRDVPDFKHKLWDHLAIMSGFKLDIDYPYEIVKPEDFNMKPNRISYPQANIRYRHYGKILGELVKKATDIEDEQKRKQFINLLAIQMKKSFANWNKDGMEEQKILDDLREYSGGAIDLQPGDLRLNEPMHPYNNQRRPFNNNQRKQQGFQKKK